MAPTNFVLASLVKLHTQVDPHWSELWVGSEAVDERTNGARCYSSGHRRLIWGDGYDDGEGVGCQIFGKAKRSSDGHNAAVVVGSALSY